MNFKRRHFVQLLVTAGATAGTFSLGAHAAEAWPSRSIRIVVPFPAGGAIDVLGRVLAKKINEAIPGSSVVVENITGGSTVPAALNVLRDKADGHTLFLASDNTLNINRWLLKSPGYDADTDFTSVTVLNSMIHWLVVKPGGKHGSFAELFQYIRNNPGKAAISVNALGGTAHLALDNWKRVNNLDFTVVPYRGSPPAIIDLIGGQTDAHLDLVGASVGHARGGKVIPVAVCQPDPLPEFPLAVPQKSNDPTGLIVQGNLSVVVRRGTPKNVVDNIYVLFKKIAQDNEVVDTFKTLQFSPILMEPTASDEFVRSETKRYERVVEQSGLEKQ